MDKRYYFVYGTLKKGHGNHRILENCEKIGDFKTEPEFTMFSLGGFPGIIRGGKTAVVGELYEVEDTATEQRLDRLEGYTPNSENNFYNKEVINIDGKNAFIYTFNASEEKIKGFKTIESGKW